MASKELNVKVKHRYDTASNWTTNNPVLLAGELGIESDTKNVKIGDGTKTWSQLPYFTTNIRASEKNELNTNIANAHTFTKVESTEAGMLSWTNAKRGYICIRTDLNKTFILSQEPASNIDNWIELLFPLPDIIAISLKVQNGAVNLIRLINGEEVPQTAFYIRNELTSDDSNSALSASQGKELKRLIDLRYTKSQVDDILNDYVDINTDNQYIQGSKIFYNPSDGTSVQFGVSNSSMPAIVVTSSTNSSYSQTFQKKAGTFALTDDIPAEYLKSVSVSGDTLTITKQNGSTVSFKGGGGVTLRRWTD